MQSWNKGQLKTIRPDWRWRTLLETKQRSWDDILLLGDGLPSREDDEFSMNNHGKRVIEDKKIVGGPGLSANRSTTECRSNKPRVALQRTMSKRAKNLCYEETLSKVSPLGSGWILPVEGKFKIYFYITSSVSFRAIAVFVTDRPSTWKTSKLYYLKGVLFAFLVNASN